MAKKYEEKLARLNAKRTLEVGVSRNPPGVSESASSRYGQAGESEDTVLGFTRSVFPSAVRYEREPIEYPASIAHRKVFVDCDIISAKPAVSVARFIAPRPFRPESLLLFGAGLDSEVESVMVGARPQLLTPLPAAMFETASSLFDMSVEQLETMLRDDDRPALRFLLGMMQLRELKWDTLMVGNVLTIVITGPVQRVVAWGSTID